MAKYNIYSSLNILRGTVKSLEYSGKWMEDSYIRVTVEAPNHIEFQLGDYIDYRGVRYVLNELPNVSRQHASHSSGSAVVYEGVRFDSPIGELKRCMFLDCISDESTFVSTQKQLYTNSPTFDFFCEDVTTLGERIQLNLDRLYGSGKWAVRLAEGQVFSAGDINLHAENMVVWDAVQWINTKFKTSFTVTQKTDYNGHTVNYLTIGESMVLNGTMLEHGKGKGLTQISRSKDDNSGIVNRLRVYGSDKNLPTRYYNEIYDPWYRLQLSDGKNFNDTTVTYLVAGNFGWLYRPEDLVHLQLKVFFNSDSSKQIYTAKFDISGNLVVFHQKGYTQDAFNFFTSQTNAKQLIVISGLSKSYMRNVREYWLSPIPLAPHEMAITNLMLPSFLQYHTSIGTKLLGADVIPVFDSNNEWNVTKLYHKQTGQTYDPVYLYDSKGNHILDYRGKWALKLETDPYLQNDDSVKKYGVREGCVFFDSDDEGSETPSIYPTIKDIKSSDAIAAGYTINLTDGDNGNLDQVFIGTSTEKYEIPDDGVIDEDPMTEDPVKDFCIEIKDLGFDLKDYLSDARAVIKMTSGACAGREFEFVRNNNNPISLQGKDYVSYQLRLLRSHDDVLDRFFPNKDAKINAGDTFVLLNIDLPRMFIDVASQKLLTAGREFLREHATTTYNTVTPQLDALALARDYDRKGTDSLYYQLREGSILQVKDDELGIKVNYTDSKYYIDSLTIREAEGKVPTVDVKLVKEKEYSTIQKLQNEIHEVKFGGAANLTRVEAEEIARKVGQENFVNKTTDDTVQGALTMKKTLVLDAGFETADVVATENSLQSKDYGSGLTGTGYALTKEEDGSSLLEVDNLTVRKKMFVNELEIQKTTHIGGKQLLTAAMCTAYRVDAASDDSYFRVYFLRKDGEGKEIQNTWEVGDQAYCRTFNTGNDRYYWRVVKGTGSTELFHYIDLSNRSYESSLPSSTSQQGFDTGSDIPEVGDTIVQLGNRYGDTSRTSAIELSGAGVDSPYIRQYSGITTFALPKPDTQIKPGNNIFSGNVHIKSGSTGVENFTGITDLIQSSVIVGGENLLLNTGFDGEYESIDPSADGHDVGEYQTLSNDLLKYWTRSNTSITSATHASSGSGRCCSFGSSSGGYITQSVTLGYAEKHVLSLRSDYGVSVYYNGALCTVDSQGNRRSCVITGTGSSAQIRINTSQSNRIWDVKLERGTVVTDWSPSPKDVDPVADKLRDTWYLMDALRSDSALLGGLFLTRMIKLGKFKNGVFTDEKAGVSGIMNDGDDVAFWAGGTFTEAVQTIAKIRTNAGNITQDEWNKLIGFVATHGGDMFLKGYIYAKGGVFQGELKAATGTFSGELQAATGSFSGEVTATKGTFSNVTIDDTCTVKGRLDGATGTFSGELQAATGTFSGTLQTKDVITGTVRDKVCRLTSSNIDDYSTNVSAGTYTVDIYKTGSFIILDKTIANRTIRIQLPSITTYPVNNNYSAFTTDFSRVIISDERGLPSSSTYNAYISVPSADSYAGSADYDKLIPFGGCVVLSGKLVNDPKNGEQIIWEQDGVPINNPTSPVFLRPIACGTVNLDGSMGAYQTFDGSIITSSLSSTSIYDVSFDNWEFYDTSDYFVSLTTHSGQTAVPAIYSQHNNSFTVRTVRGTSAAASKFSFIVYSSKTPNRVS